MCQHCEEMKAKKERVLPHAEEIGELAILATGEINSVTQALKLKLSLDRFSNAGLLDTSSLLLLIAHFAKKSKTLENDNKALHESLNYLSTLSDSVKGATPKPDESKDQQKMLPIEAIRLLESVANTFENAQLRAMEGVNAQIREMKNRYGLNK